MTKQNLSYLKYTLSDLTLEFFRVMDVINRDSDFDEYISDNYPFDKSFDEVFSEVIEWNVTMRNKIDEDLKRR